MWGSRRAAAKSVSRARLGGWHGPGALEKCSPEGFQQGEHGVRVWDWGRRQGVGLGPPPGTLVFLLWETKWSGP